MLRLPIPADELSWLDLLPGVRVRVRSATPAAMIAARAEAGQAYRPEHAPEGEDAPDNRRWNAAELLVRALARYAISEWEGVGSAEGEPIPVTSANVDGLMKVWRAFDAFDRLYVMPVLAEGEEKKRLIALAKWHFGGGADYCRACEDVCEGCPYTEHAPQTAAGHVAWAVVERCGGQVRTHFGGVYGLDFTAILMMAAAMGAPSALLSEILPAIEPVVVAAYREGTENAD